MSIDLNKYSHVKPVQEHSVKKAAKGTQKNWWEQDIQLFANGLGMKQKESFYAELEVLLKAGLDLKTALELVAEGKIKAKEKALFEQIVQTVVHGENLSRAMELTQKFSPYEVFSIKIAEESGKLTPILADLSTYFAKNMQYRRLLISALSYPVLVIGVALLALIFLLNFLVPLFGDIYARLDQELPAITQFIIQLSAFMQQYLTYLVIGFITTGAIFYTQRKKSWLRNIGSQLILKIPAIGSLVQQIYLARFAQAMSFLLIAKVPMLQILDLIEKMVGFYPIEVSLNPIGQAILKGKGLYEGMEPYSIYPRRMIALIKVGEEANHLEQMFAKLASQYNDEVEQQTKMLGSLIEPLLIVFLAIIVGVVLVSMYMPIFKLVTNFGV